MLAPQKFDINELSNSLGDMSKMNWFSLLKDNYGFYKALQNRMANKQNQKTNQLLQSYMKTNRKLLPI